MTGPTSQLNLQRSVLLLSQASAREKAGDSAKAIQLYQLAIQAYPLNPAGHHALILLLMRQGDFANAEKIFAAVPKSLQPLPVSLKFLHALLLVQKGQYQEALPQLESLLGSTEIDEGNLCFNIGSCFNLMQDSEKAIIYYERALNAGLRISRLFKDWAGIYQQRADIPAAEKLYAEALRNFPEDAEILHEYAGFLLKTENYQQGFSLYEHRWKSRNRRPTDLPIPAWSGTTRVRSLLILKEQGIGDQIVYSTFLPAMLEKAERVMAAFDVRLAPLLQRSFPGLDVVTHDLSGDEVAQRFDAYVTCADMGRFVPEAIGWKAGHLKPDTERVALLRGKYQQRFPGKRLIGISWSSKRATYGEMKSVDLLAWRPVLENPACQFISMQYGDISADLQRVRELLGIDIHVDPDVDSFNDLDGLAAQAHALDLVISTSNSTAHVAAATDAPTWVIIPAGQGLFWYWGYRETETRWYPHARLFRTKLPAVWQPTMEAVGSALRAHLEKL